MWDRLLIARGEAALQRDDELSTTRRPYALQAAIAVCHARSFRREETDWAEVVALYDALASAMPSPIVELSRAVAISMASGPAAGLPRPCAGAEDEVSLAEAARQSRLRPPAPSCSAPQYLQRPPHQKIPFAAMISGNSSNRVRRLRGPPAARCARLPPNQADRWSCLAWSPNRASRR